MNIEWWFWESKFDLFQIKQFNKFLIKNTLREEYDHEGSLDVNTGEKRKRANVKLIEWRNAKTLFSDLVEECYSLNIREFGYNLYNLTDFEYVNYNIYDEKSQGHYDWHTDGAMPNERFDTKFTILINLSEKPYEGGQLELFSAGEKEITNFSKPGSVLMFKSFYNHRVLPVTKGTRKTLAIWLKGPKFI